MRFGRIYEDISDLPSALIAEYKTIRNRIVEDIRKSCIEDGFEPNGSTFDLRWEQQYRDAFEIFRYRHPEIVFAEEYYPEDWVSENWRDEEGYEAFIADYKLFLPQMPRQDDEAQERLFFILLNKHAPIEEDF